MGILIFWVGLSVIVGIAAGRRDRSGAGWFILSLLISPLLAGLLMLALGNARSSQIPGGAGGRGRPRIKNLRSDIGEEVPGLRRTSEGRRADLPFLPA